MDGMTSNKDTCMAYKSQILVWTKTSIGCQLGAKVVVESICMMQAGVLLVTASAHHY
jgi:hypothetical protein